MSSSDKIIPTLDEMIFPGRNKQTEDSSNKSTSSKASNPAPTAKPAVQKKPATESKPSSNPKRNNFETMVNRQVDAILAKHMKAARAEIVRAVMIELRSRLPVTNPKE